MCFIVSLESGAINNDVLCSRSEEMLQICSVGSPYTFFKISGIIENRELAQGIVICHVVWNC